MTIITKQHQTRPQTERKTLCAGCIWRDVDMSEHCDLHTQRREKEAGKLLVVDCDGYVQVEPVCKSN